MIDLINKLRLTQNLQKHEFLALIDNDEREVLDELISQASAVRDEIYGRNVYFRGLIEFTNYCKQNCYYCGIGASNKNVNRYRLTKEDIIECCEHGYKLGFRTFVLQGGEDPYFTNDRICDIVKSIKENFSDCAVTLSIGEKSYDEYENYFKAGADRFLLRHESANETHYSKLHPDNLSLKNRKQCLMDLKKIGFQVGAGFMVGSPYQTNEFLVEDLMFLKDLNPHMVGIGPFIPHKDTRFANFKAGTLNKTLKMLAITRLMLPNTLLPATTALGSIVPNGRELGLCAGANVVMPNLSPSNIRKNYNLYDGKISMNAESAEGLELLKKNLSEYNFNLLSAKGDSKVKLI